MNRQNENLEIVSILAKYFKSNKNVRFFQGLWNLGIIEKTITANKPPQIINKYNEESSITLSKMIKGTIIKYIASGTNLGSILDDMERREEYSLPDDLNIEQMRFENLHEYHKHVDWIASLELANDFHVCWISKNEYDILAAKKKRELI